jgi:hypothetical protein
MKIGDRVEILRQDIFALNHRKIRTGRIRSIDGAYILVRPSWCWWITEVYPNEIKVLGKWKGKARIKRRGRK